MLTQGIVAGLREYMNIPTTTGMHGGRRKENEQA